MKQLCIATCVLLVFSATALGQDFYNSGDSRSQTQEKKHKNNNDQQHGFGSSWNNQNSFMKPYQDNTYGPGIHSDATGKPFTWETQNGDTSHTKVKPDGYGLGVGRDEYGRPVKPKPFNNY